MAILVVILIIQSILIYVTILHYKNTTASPNPKIKGRKKSGQAILYLTGNNHHTSYD
jgi:hypothetical protein